MKEVSYTYKFTHTPHVFKRGQHALIALVQNNQLILGSKDLYPEGIHRLVGGGIDPDEDPRNGAQRELEEELGITLEPEDFEPIAQVSAHITEKSQNKHGQFSDINSYQFTTYIFFAQSDQPLHPDDDLDGIVLFNQVQLKQLIDNFNQLPDDLITIVQGHQTVPATNRTPVDQAFRWSDYGQVYAQIHQLVLDYLVEKEIWEKLN